MCFYLQSDDDDPLIDVSKVGSEPLGKMTRGVFKTISFLFYLFLFKNFFIYFGCFYFGKLLSLIIKPFFLH